MRDILVTLMVFIGCVCTLKRPYYGILLWSWLGYMNPHRLAYGFAYNMPFAQITAIVLMVSMLFSKEKKRIPNDFIVYWWVLFVLFMGLTTIFAYFPDKAYEHYEKVIKIQFPIFLGMMLITDIDKLRKLIWVIVLSIGYYSAKGGFFTIKTGGGFKVYGPSGTFIEDNNELAVATLMVIPLMVYLYQVHTQLWVKRGLAIAIILSFFAAVGTQSRGALVALAAVSVFLWMKSKRKVLVGLGLTFLASAILSFMPETWHQRMDTIQNYQEDASAMGRINAWSYAFNAANKNFLGMGFNSWSSETFAMYAPNPTDVHAAHSIYFSVLADHGWFGMFLFILIYLLVWKKLGRLIVLTRDKPDLLEVNFLVRMMQVSFIAYLVGGAFLSLSYFDLPWHMVSFVVLIYQWVFAQYDNKYEIRKNGLIYPLR